MKSKTRHYGLAALAFTMCFVSVVGLLWIHEAQALRVSMKRIIFEGPKRSDILTILNNTAREQTYRLGWRHYRMDENKALVYLKDDDPDNAKVKWADDMIRYAPRRVTVPPGGSQQIRILLRRPRNLPTGEYRSHLWIVTETPPEIFTGGEGAPKGGGQVRLAMQPAITMPIFVRHGDLTASASITDLKLGRTKDGGSVSFVLHRGGNRSLYGDMRIVCTGGGGEYEASHSRGIAVYPEVDKRNFDFDFRYPPERAQDCSRIRLEYIADKSDSQYSGKIMAEASASLQ